MASARNQILISIPSPPRFHLARVLPVQVTQRSCNPPRDGETGVERGVQQASRPAAARRSAGLSNVRHLQKSFGVMPDRPRKADENETGTQPGAFRQPRQVWLRRCDCIEMPDDRAIRS